MRLYAPRLMDGSQIIDLIVAQGATLAAALGGYVVRDYECALLRVQGSEMRKRIPPGERIRFLNPAKTYELIRINQQQQELQFSVETDTRAIAREIRDVPVLERIKCSLALRFRVRDARRLVVEHSISSDQDLVDWIARTLTNVFLKLSRHGSASGDPLEGSVWEFLLLPVGEMLQVSDEGGRLVKTHMKLRSEELLMSMLSVQLSEIGLEPATVNILSVEVPPAARQLMDELLAARRERIVHAEQAAFQREKAIAALAKKEVDIHSVLLDAFAEKTASIDLYVGALQQYGLDAKTAMLLKSLVGKGQNVVDGTASGDSSVETLIRLFSFSLLSNFLAHDKDRLEKAARDLGVPEGIEEYFSGEQPDDPTPRIAGKFKQFLKDLYLVREEIDGETFDTLRGLLRDIDRGNSGNADESESE